MELTSVTASSTLARQSYTPAPSARATSSDRPAPTAPTSAKLDPSGSKKTNLSELQQAVDNSNKVLESKTSNELHFAIDKGADMTVVKLINRESGDTILQFPSEVMLQIAKGIDQVTGAIIQRKA